MQKLPISVLIPTMNRPRTLENTLQSFFSQEFIPSQIVIVDQSNKPLFSNQIKQILDSYSELLDIEYVFQDTPSLTQARNTAVKYAKEEIIICSDDDVEVYSDTLFNIHEIMEDTNIALIAGIDDYTKKSKTNIGFILGTKSFIHRRIGHVTRSMLGRYPDKITGEVETQWAMGYFFVIRKSLLGKWNIKWDENLTDYAYAEDLDFSYSYYKKTKEEGLRCILNDRVHVKHLASKEYRVPNQKSTYMYVINRYYLISKHHMGIRSIIAMKWCNFWRLVECILKKQNGKDFIKAIKLSKKLKANKFKEMKTYLNFIGTEHDEKNLS